MRQSGRRVRVKIEFYDKERQAYRYKPGYSVVGTVANERDAREIIDEVRRLVEIKEARHVLARHDADRMGAGDSAGASDRGVETEA